MFTNKEVEYLLGLEKSLEKGMSCIIDLNKKEHTLDLTSYQDSDYKFRLDFRTNSKIILKTTLHHMESNSYIGLLRIDFKGGHKNPCEITENVPETLIPYAGKYLNPNEPHMHIYVEDYELRWAIPLSETDFPVKNINEVTDLSNLILSFAKEINLNSPIEIQQSVF